MTTACSTMTSRERLLAAFRGEDTDRLPVWLKLHPAWAVGQPEAVKAMSMPERLRAAGCDLLLDNHLGAERNNPRVHVRRRVAGAVTQTVWDTPDGELVGEITHDAGSASDHPTRYPVQTADDLRKLRWLFADSTWTVGAEAAAAHRVKQTELAASGAMTCAYMGNSALMNLVSHLAGPETTFLLHADHPELTEEVMAAMHQDRLRELEAILPNLASDTFWLIEDTSTTLLSPSLFRRHSLPGLVAYAQKVRDHGRFCVLHMCGKLRLLLDDLAKIPADANEAFTTAPVGDITLAMGRERMPERTLLGGTNATLWLEPAERIVAAVAADLARCRDRRRIVLTSGGVLPPAVGLEKARQVVEGFQRL